MGKPGGLPSMGSHRVRHDWSDLALSIVTLGWLITSTATWDSWAVAVPSSRWQEWGCRPSAPGHPPSWLKPSLDPLPSHSSRAFASTPSTCWLTPDGHWRFICSTRTSSGATGTSGISSSYTEQLKGMSPLLRAWQNVILWRTEWQTTSVCLPGEAHEQCVKAKKIYHTERWIPQVSGCPIYYCGRTEIE